MGNYSEKSIENRQDSLEKQQKELQIRKKAFEVSKAGANLERLRRERARNIISSLKSRILGCNGNAILLTKGILNSSAYSINPQRNLFDTELIFAQQIIETYNSIKEDLKTSLKDEGDKIERLFPNRKFDTAVAGSSVDSLLVLTREFFDILEYLKRYD